MSKLESAHVKSTCIVLSIALACVLVAAERLSRMPVRVVGLTAEQQTVEAVESQVEAPVSEQPASQAKCPEHGDVRVSIEEARALLNETTEALEETGGEDRSLRLAALEGKLSTWQEHNCLLTESCDLLLGASGVSVFPEIPLSLQNLNLGGDWLKAAIENGKNGRLRESKLYLKTAGKAFKQAEKVLSKKVRLNKGSAIIKTPSYLRAIEN